MAARTKGGTPPTQPPVEDRTKTGGNGDGDGDEGAILANAAAEAPSVEVASGTSRKASVSGEGFELQPHSLVGSWFHRLESDRMIWQGAIVGEPQPGTYLVQIDRLDVGAEQVQRLIPLDRMVNDDDGYDWRFYDSEAEAKSAFGAWVSTERQRS